jgi:hypothetical protein
MRLTTAATLVTLFSASFGWDITVYKDLFCNENDVGNFEYVSFLLEKYSMIILQQKFTEKLIPI